MKYEILGSSMQSLHISLDRGERMFADSGKLVSKTQSVVMTPRLVGGIVGAMTRKATGATGLLTEFFAKNDSGNFDVAGVLPGKILAVEINGQREFVCEQYAFLACTDGINFSIQPLSFGATFFGGTGFVLQKFTGNGTVFIHVVGDLIQYDVGLGDQLEVEPGHIAGFDSSLSYSVRLVDNVKTMLFGGVGLFLATFKGKGKVFLHSVSRHKFSSEIYLQGRALNPQKKGKEKVPED